MSIAGNIVSPGLRPGADRNHFRERSIVMTLKTCPPNLKAAFAAKGIALTPAQEHLVAEAEAKGAINWANLLALLGDMATKIIPLIIAFFGGQTPPAKQAAPGCCDHHACCKKVFESACKTACLAAEHLSECCCE